MSLPQTATIPSVLGVSSSSSSMKHDKLEKVDKVDTEKIEKKVVLPTSVVRVLFCMLAFGCGGGVGATG